MKMKEKILRMRRVATQDGMSKVLCGFVDEAELTPAERAQGWHVCVFFDTVRCPIPVTDTTLAQIAELEAEEVRGAFITRYVATDELGN